MSYKAVVESTTSIWSADRNAPQMNVQHQIWLLTTEMTIGEERLGCIHGQQYTADCIQSSAGLITGPLDEPILVCRTRLLSISEIETQSEACSDFT